MSDVCLPKMNISQEFWKIFWPIKALCLFCSNEYKSVHPPPHTRRLFPYQFLPRLERVEYECLKMGAKANKNYVSCIAAMLIIDAKIIAERDDRKLSELE